jgi:hypothetical protein
MCPRWLYWSFPLSPITRLVYGKNCPTPFLAGMVGVFKLSYKQGFVSTQNQCHMDLCLAWLVLTCHLHQQQLPLHRPPWVDSCLGCHSACYTVRLSGCLEFFSKSHLSISSLSWQDCSPWVGLRSHRLTSWPSREPSDLNRLEHDGPLSYSRREKYRRGTFHRNFRALKKNFFNFFFYNKILQDVMNQNVYLKNQ